MYSFSTWCLWYHAEKYGIFQYGVWYRAEKYGVFLYGVFDIMLKSMVSFGIVHVIPYWRFSTVNPHFSVFDEF